MTTNILANPQDRQQYLEAVVKPLMLELSASYWAASPPPESIEAFLIEVLIKKYHLEPPSDEPIPPDELQKQRDQTEALRKRVGQLTLELQSVEKKAANRIGLGAT
mmetsp:Transcript_73896/g.175892  ORF Transcript_73896/g.175892 Transcript_73896/m.175892 type:complete len:106 (-) Transcript_73896:61-378(-)|eukprot:CAMPEP_0178446488 /NCGR_PEP_ID=MMETSP0689_2-20121128/40832_1 /TAXON_ID=160604 /ORGANISM="Amphidinium massartii, Strain CS-259" /LENGTH=105 /DNA_ID=CAMNT_0020071319 /DNA_START=45 /DNA_END=362 /DNA_ORIENTATION=-